MDPDPGGLKTHGSCGLSIRILTFLFTKIKIFSLKVTQREKVVNMPVVNKTRHLEQELTGGHKMPEDQMKKVQTFSY
jgi:hypothetical protein